LFVCIIKCRLGFTGGVVRLKNSDGSIIRGALPVFANLVLKRIGQRKLREAASICRFSNERHLWAVLGGHCLETSDLSILEECYKATGYFDKIDQIERARTQENKNTKLAEVKILGNDLEAVDAIVKRGETLDSLKVNKNDKKLY